MRRHKDAQVSVLADDDDAFEKKKLRVYKMSDSEYAVVQAAASSENEPVAEVIRRSLMQYAARIERKQEKARMKGKQRKAA